MSLEERIRRLEEIDKKRVWHPFTQMAEWTRPDFHPLIITEGRDTFIKDIRGRWYLDGVSSLWVNIWGHGRQEIGDAIAAQLSKISHSTLLGLSNEPAIQLAELLGNLMEKSFGPGRLTKIFYSDNGSTSVEVALKMAFQYWQLRGEKGKTSFLALENAYHGDTLGAVSAGGVEIFHEAFRPLLFKTFKAPSPYCYRCALIDKNCGPISDLSFPQAERAGQPTPHPLLGEEGVGGFRTSRNDKTTEHDLTNACLYKCLEKMEEILKEHSGEIAALILEPMVQAAGGMIFFPPGYLKKARGLCDKYNVLLIADEVATGFGRTGKMFACEHEGIVPDLICLSKGITGGYLPLAVTITTEEVYGAFLGDYSELKTFFHGHSYTGNPLACAAAIAATGLFEKEGFPDFLVPKIRLLKERLQEISALPHVGEARGLGLVAGIELVKDKKTKAPWPWQERAGWQAALRALDKGLFIRPLGNVLVIMPPLSISTENLSMMMDIIESSILEAFPE